MSKQIITDYMAGKIGDKYYESIGGKLEYIAEIGAIDDNDNNQRYKLESNDHCLSWSMKECFDHFEREVPDEESDSEPYVPTTEEVCDGFHGDPRKFEQAGEPIDAIGSNYGSKCYAAFHRWLKEHDERIRREALTATDEELAVMEAAFDTAIEEREDDGIGAMGIAMKVLAAIRERES